MASQTTSKPLINNRGMVIGRLERDLASGTITPFWLPQPRPVPAPGTPAPVTAPAPQPDGDRYVPMYFEAPDVLGRAVRLQRDPTLVAEVERIPVRGIPLPRPAARETYAPTHDLMTGVLREQVRRGWRPAPEPPLHVMGAQPCERCGRVQCPCPPAAPKVLEAAVAHRQREVARRDGAFDAAGHPRLRY